MVWVDQREAAGTLVVSLRVGAAGRVAGRVEGAALALDLETVGATYLRPIETGKACGSDDPQGPAYLRAAAVDTALIAWADLSPTAVVNRPAAMAANNAKPYQLSLIARAGFAAPDTLVTTDAAAVAQFRRRHRTIIYKSVSGIRSIVSRLAEGEVDLEDVGNCPTQFQEYVPGTDVRVHVAGDALLATEIQSPADDYRYASRSSAGLAMLATELPRDVAERCRSMVREMGLLVAGVDLRRTPDGAWYCFEVNPSPGFTFFEAGTGQPIADMIARLLIERDLLHQQSCANGEKLRSTTEPLTAPVGDGN
jgi:glutathione synthase/RimK-type ligase-like ATP-grasp enzyme